MNIGANVKTLPTVKPKLYAGRVGTIAVRNEDEFGVLINGKIVWFVEKEIEEWTNAQSTKNPGCREISTGVNVAPTTFQSSARARTTDARRTDSPAIRPGPPQHPMTNPPRAVLPPRAASELRPPSAASRGSGDLSGFKPGERGPGGGVVAQCVACGGKWERPKQRGRPSLKCEGCR